MTKTDLKSKAIDIKGKKYVLVSDRVLAFNADYPNGSIQTELVSQPDDSHVVIKAIVIPDVENPMRVFTDYSQAVIGDSYINKTAALENASTSAVGRALAYMGIGVLDSIASVDEIRKAEGAVARDKESGLAIVPSETFEDFKATIYMAEDFNGVNALLKELQTVSMSYNEKKKLKELLEERARKLKE